MKQLDMQQDNHQTEIQINHYVENIFSVTYKNVLFWTFKGPTLTKTEIIYPKNVGAQAAMEISTK